MEQIEDLCDLHGERNKRLGAFATALLKEGSLTNEDDLRKAMHRCAKIFKLMPNKNDLRDWYREHQVVLPNSLERLLVKKSVRSRSGIINVSVVLPPDQFSCRYNCRFCPNEPGMPRSYLSNEDAVARAKEVDFDPVLQVYSRLKTLEINGHPLDKIEFRILGGTFSNYPHGTTENFIRDLYYGANTYGCQKLRPPFSLEQEQEENVHAKIHVVGLGLETRPDAITLEELWRFRRYGCTRVEIGVQHTCDDLLKIVGRGHGIRHSKQAIRLLKDHGFKVEVHIMLDLPGSSPEMDMDCYRLVLREDPDLIPDYLKDYPCLDVSFTEIKSWKETGRWKPYAEEDPGALKLRKVLVYRQSITPPWVRVNRIQRDFPLAQEKTSFLGYTSGSIMSNLGQVVRKDAENEGIFCRCIRCREIGDHDIEGPITFSSERFTASGADEYFLSAVDGNDRLLGFCRLRITGTSQFECLSGKTGLIRELHVYGRVTPVDQIQEGGAQHRGIGRTLLTNAETVAKQSGVGRIAIIAAVGTRGYYKKMGYEFRDTYMIKDIPWYKRGFLGYIW